MMKNTAVVGNIPKSNAWMTITFTAVLIVGAIFSWWTVQWTDQDMRETLLHQTRMLAQAVDLNRVRALTGSETDVSNPNYQQLKEQFAAIKRASDQCRFVCLLGRKPTGELSTLVDNEPPESPDYSPPGEVYEEASDGEMRVFATSQENVVGPFINRWGVWVSAFIPLCDPQTGDLIAVFGMDIDAGKWRHAVITAAAWPMGLTLTALVLLAMIVLLSQSRRRLLEHQKSLRESEDRYKRITETITDYVFTVRIENGKVVSTKHGPGCQAVTGYREDELEQDPFLWLNMVPPEDREQVIKQTQLATLGKQIKPLIHRIVRKDGKVRWVENTPVYQRDNTGVLLSYDGLVHDITESKLADEAIKESHTGLLEIFDCIDEPVYVADTATYELIFTNRTLEAVFGTPSNQKCYEHLQNRNSPCPFCTNEKILGEYLGRSYVWEFQNEANKRWYKCIDKAISWPDGRLVRYEMAVDITERKQAEEALQKSRDLLNTTQNLAKVGGWEWDIERKSLTGTDETYRILGLDAKKIVAGSQELIKASISCFDPQDQPIMKSAFQLCITEGIPYNLEFPITNTQGRHVWIQTMAQPVYEDGQIVKIVGNIVDITERKQAEEKLRESEKRFHLLADLAPVGIAISDVNDKILFLSSKFIEMFGYDQNDLPSIDIWWDLAYPDPTLREQAREAWKKSVVMMRQSRKEMLPRERSIIRKDGKELQVEVRSASSGDLVFVVFTDITDRKKAEETLLRTQFAMDRASDNIMWVDGEANIIYANDAACLSLGYTREELLRKRIFDIDPDFTREHWRPHVEELRRMGALRFESRHQAKDGRIFPVEVTGNYLEFGGRFYSCAFDRDISELKRAEEERQRLQEHLNQAQKMESVGRLAGGVAHDFNNMLGVILGHTGMALDQVDPSQPIFTNLKEIQEAAERSADLTRQLLAFARKQTAVPKVLDLNETVEGMLNMLRRLIGEDIDLAWRPGKKLGLVKVDPSQIDQILANLCVNARDAIGGTGMVTIETGTATFDEAYCAEYTGFVPGDYTMLAVSDNGCGMDKQTLEKIFEPFYTTKPTGKGTGLGLATVYGIVKQNDGFINVVSEPWSGTTFKVFFPQHTVKDTPLPMEASVKPVITGNETILLVEDESMILDMTKTMLEYQGYTVLTAATPGEAIHLAESYTSRIDLLMTDVVMPEMNGRDLAKNLVARRPNLKCLFTSGYTANVIAHHGVLDEGVHFIQKPFNMMILTTKVRDVLDS